MKLTYITLPAVALTLLSTSCTDATRSKVTGYGGKYKVELYSGGKLVKEWTASGKVQSEETSDGYYFKDEKTDKLIEVSGTVIITRL